MYINSLKQYFVSIFIILYTILSNITHTINFHQKNSENIIIKYSYKISENIAVELYLCIKSSLQ